MNYFGPHFNLYNNNNIINLPQIAYNLGASTFSFIIHKNNQIDKFNYISNKFNKNIQKYNFKLKYIIPHSNLFINLGHYNKYKLDYFRFKLLKEIKILNQLNIYSINCHLGYHLHKITNLKCLNIIIESINFILNKCKYINLIIENSAGQGTSIGSSLTHLSTLIANTNNKNRIGICLDTCHLSSSGYKIFSYKNLNSFFNMFDQQIGMKYLKLIHLNDSKTPFNSKKDRHAHLFKGYFPKNFFLWFLTILNTFKKIPIILESTSSILWKKELKWLNHLTV